MDVVTEVPITLLELTSVQLEQFEKVKHTKFAAIFQNYTLSKQVYALYFHLQNGILEITSHAWMRGIIYFEESGINHCVKIVFERSIIRINDAHEHKKWRGIPKFFERIIQEINTFLHDCWQLSEFEICVKHDNAHVNFESAINTESINIRFCYTW